MILSSSWQLAVKSNWSNWSNSKYFQSHRFSKIYLAESSTQSCPLQKQWEDTTIKMSGTNNLLLPGWWQTQRCTDFSTVQQDYWFQFSPFLRTTVCLEFLVCTVNISHYTIRDTPQYCTDLMAIYCIFFRTRGGIYNKICSWAN